MKLTIKYIVLIALLSAFAVVLSFFPHFPILPAFPFLKLDFADVPALFASLVFPPFFGIFVEAVKNVITTLISGTTTGFVGELANFLIGSVYCLSAGLLAKYTFRKTLMKWKLIFLLPIAVILETACACVINYFLLGPIYGLSGAALQSFVAAGALPFNLIKGALQAVVLYFLYRGVGGYLQKNLFRYR